MCSNKDKKEKYLAYIKDHRSELFDGSGNVFFSDQAFRIVYGSDYQYEYMGRIRRDDDSIKIMEMTIDGGTSDNARVDYYRNVNDDDDDEEKRNNDMIISPFYETCRSIGVDCYASCENEIRIGIGFADDYVIFVESFSEDRSNVPLVHYIKILSFVPLSEEFLEGISSKVIFKKIENKSMKNRFSVVVKSSFGGLGTSGASFKNWDGNIEKNYNDDLPYNEIMELMVSDSPQLILFHGKAGTGKSSLIKTIINDCQGKCVDFIYFPSDIFKISTSTDLMSFFSAHRNSICIMEDCEKILLSRDVADNGIDLILNLTDGLIGEYYNIKFICTFNTSESKIDKALLRKGRLSLKYEFKELSLDKCKAILPNATKPMVLADLYNEGDNGTKEEKKIGFC